MATTTSSPSASTSTPMPESKSSTNNRKRMGKQQRRFSLLVETETLHCIDEVEPKGDLFVGPWAHIRKELDYSYHSHYTKHRQWLQDSIIDKLLGELVETGSKRVIDGRANFGTTQSTKNLLPPSGGLDVCNIPKKPWLIFAAGEEVQDKSVAIRALLQKRKLPLLGFLLVDPLEIMDLLPEFAINLRESNLENAMSVASRETGYLTEILTLAALQAGLNVLVYGIFRDGKWYNAYCDQLKDQFHLLKIAILHFVHSNEEDKTIDELKQHVDYYCQLKLSNSTELDILTEGVSWESFRDQWQQSCAYVPAKLQKQRRASMELKFKNTDRRQMLLMMKQVQSTVFTKEEMDTTCKEACEKSFRPSLGKKGDSNNLSSLSVSSEENNKSDDMVFYGPYAHIRKTLDYTYHSNYTRERQVFQDAIIAETLTSVHVVDVNGNICTTPTEPFLLFTAGAMGAGKSYTLNNLHSKGLFPLAAFVRVDPDEIRQMFPEYSIYVEQNPLQAGELTRKEAGYIVEILTIAALQSGKNVLVDGSLRDWKWYKKYFSDLQKQYSNMKLAILHIDAPKDAVIQRAKDRGIATGRMIPIETLEMALRQVPESVNILKHHVEYYCRLMNSPSSKEIQLMNENISWDSFKRNWIQTCAWIPKEKIKKKISL